MTDVIPGGASERRIITVLFCDVVSSTAMAERLDAEEWTEIMNEAFDAVLAFFGAGHRGYYRDAVDLSLQRVPR